MTVTLHAGDNRDHLRRLIDQGVRVHSVLTDPPYGLTSITKRFGKEGSAPAKFGSDGAFGRASAGFMGKAWDGTGIERDPAFWRLIYDILLPGGYCFAFSGSRTGHWQACAMEIAGFIMHPMHGWCFGSGFPKAHAADKAIDKMLVPGSDEASQWEGWAYGTQTQKPALESIYLGQKPFELIDLFRPLTRDCISKIMDHVECQSKDLATELTSHANIAELVIMLSDRGLIYPDIARNLVRILRALENSGQIGEAELILAMTDMLSSELAQNPSSNTAKSWLTTLVALWSLGNTFTTAITSDTITDLKTWNSLAGQITRDCTMLPNEPIGDASGVIIAGECLRRACASLLSRLSTIATELVIAPRVQPVADLAAERKSRLEPIYLAQKPFSERTGAANLLKHGVGAVNIDGCRVGDRHPSNLILDGSPEVVAMFPATAGARAPVKGTEASASTKNAYGQYDRVPGAFHADKGSAARFFHQFPLDTDPLFYHPKAGKADRAGSSHPTVKPIALLQYLARHITPPGGTILDPFAGSGTTAVAAEREGFDCILMEAEPEYVDFLRSRFDSKPHIGINASYDLTDLLSPDAGANSGTDLAELLC